MRAILMLALMSISVCGQAQDSECIELLKVEKEYAKKLPIKIDEVTRLVEFSVNCSTKRVKYVKHVSVSGTVLPEGFQKRKQRQYANLHCNKQGLATNGWTVNDYIYDKDRKLVMKLEATTRMCNQ